MLAFLAPLLPFLGEQIAKLVMGDTPVASKVADAAVSVVSQVTGISVTDEHSARSAAQALTLNAEQAAEVQNLANQHAVSIMAEETKRLAVVNETIRNEANSADPFVRRMRPFFGYIMALTWGAQMAAASYVIVTDPGKAAAVLSGISETTLLWGAGLAVLGVYVWKRSDEKGAGGSPLDMLGGLRKR